MQDQSGSKDAWEYLQHVGGPAIVLLDWMMPGLDGLEVCRRLRDMESKSSSYVILLTSRDAKGDIIQCLDAGDEFAIVLPHTEIINATKVVESLRGIVEQKDFHGDIFIADRFLLTLPHGEYPIPQSLRRCL